LIQENISPAQPLAAQAERAIEVHLGPQRVQRQKMSIHPPPPDHIAARPGQAHRARPSQHRSG
jgi:hypothetical protein